MIPHVHGAARVVTDVPLPELAALLSEWLGIRIEPAEGRDAEQGYEAWTSEALGLRWLLTDWESTYREARVAQIKVDWSSDQALSDPGDVEHDLTPYLLWHLSRESGWSWYAPSLEEKLIEAGLDPKGQPAPPRRPGQAVSALIRTTTDTDIGRFAVDLAGWLDMEWSPARGREAGQGELVWKAEGLLLDWTLTEWRNESTGARGLQVSAHPTYTFREAYSPGPPTDVGGYLVAALNLETELQWYVPSDEQLRAEMGLPTGA